MNCPKCECKKSMVHTMTELKKDIRTEHYKCPLCSLEVSVNSNENIIK